jgi:hypothetical protein
VHENDNGPLEKIQTTYNMAIPVVEFSREGYKIRNMLAKNQLYSNEVTKF